MEVSPLLRLPEGLALTAITLDDDGLLLHAEATAQSTSCPLCACPAIRVHSRYTRTAVDLPCASRRVRLCLHIRRFRCETPTCPRKIFVEGLSPFLAPWARMTARLGQAIEVVGLATCGELGARLGERLGIHTSPTTILRRIMAVPTPAPLAVSALGIDDFALLRGRRYSTILVDLTQHQVIELLPDRQAETAATWMEQHPEIELGGRDRGGDYASASSARAIHQARARWSAAPENQGGQQARASFDAPTKRRHWFLGSALLLRHVGPFAAPARTFAPAWMCRMRESGECLCNSFGFPLQDWQPLVSHYVGACLRH